MNKYTEIAMPEVSMPPPELMSFITALCWLHETPKSPLSTLLYSRSIFLKAHAITLLYSDFEGYILMW